MCRLRPSPLPYYVYKEEILCMNPRVAMVYDVITDKEAEHIKSMAHSRVKNINPSFTYFIKNCN